MISITIPGQPTAKGRARSTVRNGKTAHYTPEKTVRYENLVKVIAQEAMQGRKPSDKPISIEIHAYFQIPKSWSKKKKIEANNGRLAHTSRPDLDNVIKSIKDGLNGVAWIDDSQVFVIAAMKFYRDQPRVIVDISECGAE